MHKQKQLCNHNVQVTCYTFSHIRKRDRYLLIAVVEENSHILSALYNYTYNVGL